jgi:hypothetical protein
MEDKIYRATFIGENGSMGLEKGIEYKILIKKTNNSFIIVHLIKQIITVYRMTKEDEVSILNPFTIPYMNIETFLNNWDKIESEC